MLDSRQWQEVSPYLDQALLMPPERRASWLAQLRARNPELGATLDSLLEEHRKLEDEHFLEVSGPPSGLAEGRAGKTVGAYTLLTQIGHGGMGTVWLAERNDGRFERLVAVKFLSVALAGRGGEERFRREGSILGSLAHAHIAELIDAGVDPAGQPYLVIEYVKGEHIDHYSDQRKLSVRTRVRLFLDVLAAVAHAHSNLIVHRDIKPSNVLVSDDAQVKLLDFGIAKLLEQEDGGSSLLTVEAGRHLTPEYAAPEQLTGGAVTTGTDVYALGVLLYFLLTGQHPAGSGTRSYASLVKSIMEEEPLRPSEAVKPPRVEAGLAAANAARRSATPDKLCRALRGDLDNIVAKALKKNPEERYLSAAALADDLRHYLRNEPVTARPDTVAYRAAKFVRRNRAAVLTTLVAGMAAAAGLVGTLMQARTVRVERDFALRQVRRIAALNEFHQFLVSDAAPSGKPISALEILGRAEDIVTRQHAADDPHGVELMASIGRQYAEQDAARSARRVLERAYKLSRRLSDPSVRAVAACVLAASLARDEEVARAEALFEQGLRELPPGPQFALERIACLGNGSEVAQQGNDMRKAVGRAQEALRILRESPFDSDVLEMHAWTDLAKALTAAGRDQEAVSAFENAGRLLTALGRDHTTTAGVLFNDWALELDQMGRPAEAEKLFLRAIDINRSGGAEDAVSPMMLNNYARSLRELGRLKEAEDYAQRAYAKARQVDHQLVINQSLLERARVYLAEQDPARAEAMLAEVEPRLRRSLPPGHYAFAVVTSLRALAVLEKGDAAAALKLADEAVAIEEAAVKAGSGGRFFLPALLIGRARIELDAGLPERAAGDATRVLHEAPAGKPTTLTGRAYLLLGRALGAQGRPAEAQAALASAAGHLQAVLGPENSETLLARRLAGTGTPDH